MYRFALIRDIYRLILPGNDCRNRKKLKRNDNLDFFVFYVSRFISDG